MNVRVYNIRELVRQQLVRPVQCSTSDQHADICTKALPGILILVTPKLLMENCYYQFYLTNCKVLSYQFSPLHLLKAGDNRSSVKA